MLIIPGYDSKTGNTNSCLYKTYGDACYRYTPESDLKIDHSDIAIVHSYGFFIFLVGQSKGLFPNVKKVVVLDGWFPRDKIFKGETYTITFPKMHFVFLFPTVGDRADYPLESIVRQAMANGARFSIVRAIGYGHNLIFKEVKEVGAIVESLKDFEEPDSEAQIKFPESYITYI